MRHSEPVNRLMTEKVLAIEISAPAGEILRYFAEYPVHHLPVVDKNLVVGMLSSADVLKLEAFLPKGGDPIGYLNTHVRIDQIMRQPPITIGPHAAVEQAASLMARHGIHALPVVSEPDGHLLGIITTTDIISAAIRHDSRGGEQSVPSRSPRPLSHAQMQEALSLAKQSASAEGEQGALARALLYAESRQKTLDAVLVCAERYVRAGQDERLHTTLLRAIEKAREESSPPRRRGPI